MSLFSWLSGPTRNAKQTLDDGRLRQGSDAPLRTGRVEQGRPEDTKNHRHARREELYVAIRESMTRSGVLSARFKFKVLSLDQEGDTFLVMMDLTGRVGFPTESLTSMEQQIKRHAMSRFDIAVSSVYWRVSDSDEHKQPDFQKTLESHDYQDGKPKPAPVYKTIEIDELAAFKEARIAAAKRGPPAAARSSAPSKSRRPSSRSADFADTELTESHNAPGLSTTQYGDLN